MDVEQIYREALGISHVAALQAVFDAGVAAALATTPKPPLAQDKTPIVEDAVSAAAPAHPWNAFVAQLQG